MRKMTKKNKIAAVAASAALVAVGGGAAYAYWSTNGAGTGTAAAATGTSNVTINVTVDPGVTPGGAPKTITYTATNPNSSSSPVTLANPQVTATNKTGCLPGWFTATVPSDANGVATTTTVAGNAPAAALGTGTLTMADLADTDQNACKGATVTVTVDSH